MSGIVGIYRPDGPPVGAAEIEQMLEQIAHRGPDGRGVWVEDRVGLGRVILATSASHASAGQPAVVARGSRILVADARIDNRAELCAQLGLSTRGGHSPNDAELILAAYERWATDCVARLLGDFAFALWDQRTRQLFCARDHFGIKPFYYRFTPGAGFWFGSEIKALGSLRQPGLRLNEDRIASYVQGKPVASDTTFYADVYRLPPAHILTVRAEGLSRSRYWSLEPAPALPTRPPADWVEAFRELLTEAVRCRIADVGEIGVSLSGGLDSSALAAIAARLLGAERSTRLHTFSAVFAETTPCDEQRYQQAVLGHLGPVRHHPVPVEACSPLVDLEKAQWHQEEPLYGPSRYLAWILSRAVQSTRVRVLLDGQGGDETVSHGFGYLDELAIGLRWPTLYRQLRALANTGALPLRPLLRHYLRHGIRQQPHRLRAVWQSLWERSQPVSQSSAGHWPTERQHHLAELTGTHQPLALEILDRTSAAFAIERRYPFWDKRLVTFCLALPPECKLQQGFSRYILRRAVQDSLPESIVWRTDKADFRTVVEKGLRKFEYERMRELLHDKAHDLAKYVDIPLVQHTLRKFMADEVSFSLNDLMVLWRALSLGMWLQWQIGVPVGPSSAGPS